MPVPPGLSPKDSNQVLRAVMDDSNNRLRVDAVISPDGHDLEIHHEDDSIAIGTTTELFTATDVGPKVGLDVNIINPIEITDGTNTLAINPDGSITVQVEATTGGVLKNYYNEVLAVASGVLTTIQTYTVVATKAALFDVNVSGTNIATYTVLLNGNILIKKFTYFGSELNEDFNFSAGLGLVTGDVIQVKVIHNRPSTGDFNSRILVAET